MLRIYWYKNTYFARNGISNKWRYSRLKTTALKIKDIRKAEKIINKNGGKKQSKKVMPDTNSLYNIACFCVGAKTKFTNSFVAWRLSWIQLQLTISRLGQRWHSSRKLHAKVNNRNIKTRCEICSKLTVKTPEQSNIHWPYIVIITKCAWIQLTIVVKCKQYTYAYCNLVGSLGTRKRVLLGLRI